MWFTTDQNRRASNFREFTCLSGSESLLAKKRIFPAKIKLHCKSKRRIAGELNFDHYRVYLTRKNNLSVNLKDLKTTLR